MRSIRVGVRLFFVAAVVFYGLGCEGEPDDGGGAASVSMADASFGGEELLWRWEQKSARPAYPGTGGDEPDVFLFVLDTLRRDHVDPYRDEPGITPFIGDLANRGVVYTNAYAPSSWTVPSMYSLITGVYPREHGVQEGSTAVRSVIGQTSLSPAARTLAERLKERGYATHGICTNQHLAGKFGFGQGFDRVLGSGFLKLPFPEFALEAAGDKLPSGGPRFHWVHYFDPHFPYRANEPWFAELNDSEFSSVEAVALDAATRDYRRARKMGADEPVRPSDITSVFLRSRLLQLRHPQDLMRATAVSGPDVRERYLRFLKAAYASEVSRADDSLSRVFEILEVGDEDLVIIAADHGEEFMEHGSIGHRWLGSLSQELVRVPLVVLYPGRSLAGRCDRPVSLVDVLPTIMAAVGAPVDPSETSGEVLPGPTAGASSERPIYGELLEPGVEKRYLVRGRWKYVLDFTTGRGALFDLESDPEEDRDLSGSRPSVAARMEERLRAWMDEAVMRWPAGPVETLSDQEVERLRAMGYMK